MGNPYAPRKKSSAAVTETPAEEEIKTPVETTEPLKDLETEKKEETKLVVPETTMEGILDWVGEDKERAAAAIEHENAQSKPRKTLLSKLGDI